MRQSHSFVVTILFDDEEPDALRGRVRQVADDQEAIFVNGEELLHTVRQMVQPVISGDVMLPANRPIA